MQDNRYKTWDNYANQYWPAEYLIDRTGHIRHYHFGEGDYGGTEQLIRQLLGDSGAKAAVADTTPTGCSTPETYLGYARLKNYVGSAIVPGRRADYRLPATLPQNDFAYGGRGGRARSRSSPARTRGCAALPREERLRRPRRPRHRARLVDGKPTRTVQVNATGSTRCARRPTFADATLELRFSPGVQAYAFTFG